MENKDEMIRELAYQLWEQAPEPKKYAEEYWLCAEELIGAPEAEGEANGE